MYKFQLKTINNYKTHKDIIKSARIIWENTYILTPENSGYTENFQVGNLKIGAIF